MKNTNEIDFKISDIVQLPFNETGKIIRIETKRFDWFPFKVKIRKAVFNKTNQILAFKKGQISLL